METNSQSLVITETTGTLQIASRLVSSFLSGKSHRTLLAYRADLEGFRACVKAEDLDQAARILLSRGHGEANGIALHYRTHLVERGLQSATVNRRLAALLTILYYFENELYLYRCVQRKDSYPDHGSGVFPCLSEDFIEQIGSGIEHLRLVCKIR